MQLALPRLALRALLVSAGVVAVLLLWGTQQADAKPAKPTPPLIDLGGGIHIDVPPVLGLDIPPIDLLEPPADPGPTGGGAAPAGTTPTTPAIPTDTGLVPPLDRATVESPAAVTNGGLTAITDALTDTLSALVPPLEPVLELVNDVVLGPLTGGISSAVDQLIGPVVAVMPTVTPKGAVAIPMLETGLTPPAPAGPGAPATQSVTPDPVGGPGTPGPPGGRAPPTPVGAPGPPLGTTGSTSSGNGNRLDAGVLVLGLALALLLAFRPRDEAWWYAGVYQLEPLTRPG